MTERLSHKRDCLYKDKIMCSKPHLFVLEKADYTYNNAVIRQAGQPTHLPVICSIPSSLQRKIITRKYAQGNHFHNVLCLSEAKGMDIIMKELLESLLGHSIQTERRVPGTYLVEGREFCYVSNNSKVKFDKLFHELFNFPPKIPQSGGALIEGCKITLPNGDIFEAVSYKGDIEGWRQQLEQGAKALNEELARIDIDTNSIVLNDRRSFCLMDCIIDFY